MEEEFVVIKTSQGSLRGRVNTSIFSGNLYFTFAGIPYGKPPLGELRFKAPVPFGRWEGVKDAVRDGPDCKQEVPPWASRAKRELVMQGDEDCLYLNVSTNKVPAEDCDSGRPVMVFLHPGGFTVGSGSSTLCGPDFLLQGDVVLVSLNYRLGAFGFLSLETDDVPGNAGLKDQVLALSWVRDNISAFGGDPGNVTIFGISAGAASAQYHMISPPSHGLFHKAIIQSGSSLNPWALQPDPRHRAMRLAEILGFSSSQGPDTVLDFLQSVSADDIVTAQKTLSEEMGLSNVVGVVFSPCIETSGKNKFLSDHPRTLMETGKFSQVPVILGAVSNEGSVYITASQLNETLIDDFNEHPERYASHVLGATVPPEHETELGLEIKRLYTKDQPVIWDNIDELIAYLGDVVVNGGLERTRESILKHSNAPVFSYLFTNHARCFCAMIKSTIPQSQMRDLSQLLTESCHASDAVYLFALNYYYKVKSPALKAEDRKAIEKHVTAWTTFAATGNPNHQESEPTWKEDSESNPIFMELDETWSLRQGRLFEDRSSVWSILREKYCTNCTP